MWVITGPHARSLRNGTDRNAMDAERALDHTVHEAEFRHDGAGGALLKRRRVIGSAAFFVTTAATLVGSGVAVIEVLYQ